MQYPGSALRGGRLGCRHAPVGSRAAVGRGSTTVGLGRATTVGCGTVGRRSGPSTCCVVRHGGAATTVLRGVGGRCTAAVRGWGASVAGGSSAVASSSLGWWIGRAGACIGRRIRPASTAVASSLHLPFFLFAENE
jgi:hypothetical protein